MSDTVTYLLAGPPGRGGRPSQSSSPRGSTERCIVLETGAPPSRLGDIRTAISARPCHVVVRRRRLRRRRAACRDLARHGRCRPGGGRERDPGPDDVSANGARRQRVRPALAGALRGDRGTRRARGRRSRRRGRARRQHRRAGPRGQADRRRRRRRPARRRTSLPRSSACVRSATSIRATRGSADARRSCGHRGPSRTICTSSSREARRTPTTSTSATTCGATRRWPTSTRR